DDRSRRIFIEAAVERDDAAEGALRVAAERLDVSLLQRRSDSHAARIGVLDNGDRSRHVRIELGDELIGRVGVVEIGVGKLLDLRLRRRGHAETVFAGAVEGAPLMRVLAIAERIGQRSGDDAALRGEVAYGLGKPGTDCRIVSASAGKGLGGKLLAKLYGGRAAILLHLI